MSWFKNLKPSHQLALAAVAFLALGLGVGAYYENERWSAEVSKAKSAVSTITSENAALQARTSRAERRYEAQQAALVNAKSVARRKTKHAAALERRATSLSTQLRNATTALAVTKTKLTSAQEELNAIQPPVTLQEESSGGTASGQCDPNYEGACVPIVPYDLDCADVSGTVYVIRDDPHGFDGDGDGVGCE